MLNILLLSFVYCLFFTILALIKRKKKMLFLFTYPLEIKKAVTSFSKDIDIKRIDLYETIFNIVISIIFILITTFYLVKITGANDFILVFIKSYIIWIITSVYKSIILGCLWFCNDKSFIISGTEELSTVYKDRSFFILKLIRSTLFGLIVSLLCATLFSIIS